MACPEVIQNLSCVSQDVYDAILEGFNILLDQAVRRGTDMEEARRKLIHDFTRLEEECYEDYFNGRHAVAVVPQDNWFQLLKDIRDGINQFEDKERLHSILDRWERANQAFRAWVSTSGLNQQTLGDIWHDVDDPNDNDDDNY